MAFPTNQVNTTNLDSGTDDPSLAREDLLDAVQKLNTIISEGGAANGVALLNSSAKLNSTQIPATISATGVQTLSPTSGVVAIQDVLRLGGLTVSDLSGLTSQAGDIAYCTDGSGSTGEPTIAVYDGTNWRAIELGGILV
jgi:hypothetical protein